MKKFLILLLCTCFAALSFAATATVNGIKLYYSISNGGAEITDCSESASGALEIPSTLDGYPVTSIGEEAFSYCESLTSVTFEGVPPEVGRSVFDRVASGCKGYYPSTKASAWEAEIEAGKWKGIEMSMKVQQP